MKLISTLAGTAWSLSCIAGLSAAGEPSANDPLLADSALITVIYDIDGLGRAAGAEQLELPVLPYLDEDFDEEEGGDDLRDAFHSLLVDYLYSDEFQYEGREIDVLDEQRLLVTAPSAVHDGVVALLDYLEAASSRRAVVRWDIFEFTGVAPSDGRLAPESIEALVERGEAVLVQSRTESVPVGRTVRRRTERTQQLLGEWQVEIAASALGQAPAPQNLIGGMTLLLRVEDLPGRPGQRVRMVQRIVGDPTLLPISAEALGMVVLENNTASLTGPQSLDLFRAQATTLAGSGVLSEGEALLASAWCHSASGVSGRITRLVLEQVDSAPAPIQLADTEIRLIDLSAFYWNGLDAPIAQARQLQGRDGRESTTSYRDHVDASLTFPGEGADWDYMLSAMVEPFEWNGGAVWSEANWLLLCGATADLGELVEKFGSRLPEPRAVMFEWGIEDGDGLHLAGGRLDLEQQADGLALVGEALSYMHSREIYVAANAAAVYPELAEAFDGLWLVAHANGRGGVEIELTRNHLASLTEVDLGQGAVGSYQRAVFDSNDLRLHCVADGKRHELTELSAGPGNASFWVRATMR